jgi:hypothetical protein
MVLPSRFGRQVGKGEPERLVPRPRTASDSDYSIERTEVEMHGRTAYPNRKISETFLNFAAPVLDDLPSEAPEHRARKALQVCFTAWNAVVFADVLNDRQHLDEMRRLTADNPRRRATDWELGSDADGGWNQPPRRRARPTFLAARSTAEIIW